MKLKRRSFIQILFSTFIILNCIIYYLYLNDYISFKVLSIGDLNPYGGWSALKSSLIDVSYRWRGITKSIALTISITISTLLLGRFFCGYICPIGAVQDFFKYIGQKLKIKEIFLTEGKIFKPEMIKYLVLILALVLSILKFGNSISYLSPWLGYLNLFIGFNIQLGSVILLLIILSSLFIRRIFCRCLCPLGAYQGLLSAIGQLKIHSSDECGSCTHCLNNCPVAIEKIIENTVSPECINCLECIESKCINNSKGFTLRFRGYKLLNAKYIALSLVLLISLYILLPVFETKDINHTFAETWDLSDGTYFGVGIGFGGNLRVQVIIENDEITQINLINHNETSGYYEEVYKIISKELIYKQSLNLDVISGATATSRGFINSVRNGISQAMNIK